MILQRGEKRRLCWLAVADVCISILDIAFLLALLYIVNYFTLPEHHLGISHFSSSIIGVHPFAVILFFFLLFVIKNIAGFMVSAMQYRFVYNTASRISRENLRQYLEGPFQDYVNIDSSVINRKINQQPIEFAHYVLNGVQQIFSQMVLVTVTVLAVLLFNPLLLPMLLLLLVPPVLLVSYLIKRKLDAGRLYGKQTSEKTLQHLQEALHGFVESNLYSKHEFFINRYHRVQHKLNHYLSQRLTIQSLPPRLIEVFAVFGLLALVMANFFISGGNTIPLVSIGALMIAAYKIIPGAVKITNTVAQVKSYAYAAAGLVPTTPETAKLQPGGKMVNSIQFDNVWFDYPGKPVLASVSFGLEKGDFAVLPGLSGKGKTTLINLLLGFLCQDAGDIRLNDINANNQLRQACWNRIAYAKQQSFFLHASILENIVLQEDGYDKDRLDKILGLTGLGEMIQTFPHGLNTIITENGRNFSGGQRQRIIFARALYKDFDLLILDEPFSELDASSEHALLIQLKAMALAGKMILLITHNPNALHFCNKKIVLNECAA